MGEVLERASFAPNSTHIAKVQANAKRKHCATQTNGTQSTTATSTEISKQRKSKVNAPKNLTGTEDNIIVPGTHLLNQTKPQEVPNKGRWKESQSKQHNVVQATSSYPPSPKNHTKIASHGQKRTSIQCTHPPCLQYLSAGEKKAFTSCQRKTPTYKSTKKAPKCKCKFRERARKKRVALNSLPGSGNTWLRGLLERATGLCTGWPSHC